MDSRFALTKADWARFFDGAKIPKPDLTAGGCVSFRHHLDKPLTQALWEDLVHRLRITGLRVCKWGTGQKLVNHSAGYCIITLKEDETVSDIVVFG